jgi:hypothetical protein
LPCDDSASATHISDPAKQRRLYIIASPPWRAPNGTDSTTILHVIGSAQWKHDIKAILGRARSSTTSAALSSLQARLPLAAHLGGYRNLLEGAFSPNRVPQLG